jgi:hypothetical protein
MRSLRVFLAIKRPGRRLLDKGGERRASLIAKIVRTAKGKAKDFRDDLLVRLRRGAKGKAALQLFSFRKFFTINVARRWRWGEVKVFVSLLSSSTRGR